MLLDEIFGEWFVSWFLAWVGDLAYTPFRSAWSLLCFGLGEYPTPHQEQKPRP